MSDEANDRLIAMMDDSIEQASAVTREWMDLWRDGYNYIFNNQLDGKVRKDGWEKITANYIWPALCQNLSTIAQRNPKILAVPWEPDDKPQADLWASVLQWQFEKELQMQLMNMAAAMDGWIYGYYVGKVYWEPRKEWDIGKQEWVGGPCLSLIAPERFGVDPEAERFEDASFCYTRRKILLADALRRWPKSREELIAAAKKGATEDDIADVASWGFAARENQKDGEQTKDDSIQGRLVDLILRARGIAPRVDTGGQRGPEALPRYVMLTEFFMTDEEEERHKVEEPAPLDMMPKGSYEVRDGLYYSLDPEVWGGTKPGELIPQEKWPTRVAREYDRPMYPRGRRILRAGDIILNPDPKDQIWAFRKWPVAIGTNWLLPHTWQGANGVEMPRGLQDWINVALAHMANYVKFFGDPIIRIEDGALAGDTKNIKAASRLRSAAGAVWRFATGKLDKAVREPPPQMSAGLENFYQIITREVQDQTGSQEVSRGRQAQGKATATEIMQLSTASSTRAALPQKMLDLWNVEVMEQVADLDRAYMKPGDMVRVAGKKGAPAVQQLTQEMFDAKYDLSIKVGFALPADKERERAKYSELFQMTAPIVGPVLLPELLEAYEVDDKEAIMARVEQAQQAQSQAAQAQAQAEQQAAAQDGQMRMAGAQQDMQVKGAQAQQGMALTAAKAQQDMTIKERQAALDLELKRKAAEAAKKNKPEPAGAKK
jgi:hypothetical protein